MTRLSMNNRRHDAAAEHCVLTTEALDDGPFDADRIGDQHERTDRTRCLTNRSPTHASDPCSAFAVLRRAAQVGRVQIQAGSP